MLRDNLKLAISKNLTFVYICLHFHFSKFLLANISFLQQGQMSMPSLLKGTFTDGVFRLGILTWVTISKLQVPSWHILRRNYPCFV